MSLSASNTKRVSEAEVLAVPEPEWTDTFHPVSHARVIESLSVAVEHIGIGVKTSQYSLNKSGSQMFGTWSLDLGTPTVGYELGFRNSIDKTMAVGLCAGTNVFVCDNLCFSGDYIMFRKHTGQLSYEELGDLALNAVKGAVIEMDKLEQWQRSLHEVNVPEPDFKQLAYDMIMAYVFNPGKLPEYVRATEEEIKLEKSRTLYAVHGGATRILRDNSLRRITQGTKQLNSICDDYMELKKAA